MRFVDLIHVQQVGVIADLLHFDAAGRRPHLGKCLLDALRFKLGEQHLDGVTLTCGGRGRLRSGVR